VYTPYMLWNGKGSAACRLDLHGFQAYPRARTKATSTLARRLRRRWLRRARPTF
jgi:hypothetical protein